MSDCQSAVNASSYRKKRFIYRSFRQQRLVHFHRPKMSSRTVRHSVREKSPSRNILHLLHFLHNSASHVSGEKSADFETEGREKRIRFFLPVGDSYEQFHVAGSCCPRRFLRFVSTLQAAKPAEASAEAACPSESPRHLCNRQVESVIMGYAL